MINILLNGEAKSIPSAQTLAALLAQWRYAFGTVAVAVNDTIVPRAQYSDVTVKQGDRIEILSAMQGG